MKKQLSVFLDASRWLAAFFVVIGHVRHIICADYSEADHSGVFTKFFYYITGFGHEAVMVFFVLSGFLVGGLTFRKWKKAGVDFPDYFAHRISRIYIVLLPALAAGFAWDYAGSHWFDASGIYTNAVQFHTNSVKASIFHDLTMDAFLSNLFLARDHHLGSNAPLWSLVYEWWYYGIFAAAAGVLLHKNRTVRLLCLAALAVFALCAAPGLLLWMLIWLIGVVVFFYCEAGLPLPSVALSSLCFVAALVLSRLSTHNISISGAPSMSASFIYDFAVGSGFALLLASFYGDKGFMLPAPAFHKNMAGFSYSLYLTHFPMMIFIVAFVQDVFGIPFLRQPGIVTVVYYTATLIVLYACSFAFSRLTEKHTSKVKAFIASLLGAKEPLKEASSPVLVLVVKAPDLHIP